MKLLLWQRWLSTGLKYFYASFIYFCVTQIANIAHCDNVHCAMHSLTSGYRGDFLDDPYIIAALLSIHFFNTKDLIMLS